MSFRNPLLDKFTSKFWGGVPRGAGVYFFIDDAGAPLYIGKADSLKKRLASYRRAKPGTVPDHTLEMLELTTHLRWEQHASGKSALAREAELLQALKPPFNIMGTDPGYLILGTRAAPDSKDHARIDFRLSHFSFDDGFALYGCFRGRRKVKEGYTALLRLFSAITAADERYYFPSRLCGGATPYLYRAEVPREFVDELTLFLSGEDPRLLESILLRLLDCRHLHKFMYAPLQRDIESARIFFESGPVATRKIRRRLRLRRPFLSRDRLDRYFAERATGVVNALMSS